MLLLVLQIIDTEDGKDAVTRVDALDYRDDMTAASPAGTIESSYVRLMPHTGRYQMISLRPSLIEFKSKFVTFFAISGVTNSAFIWHILATPFLVIRCMRRMM